MHLSNGGPSALRLVDLVWHTFVGSAPFGPTHGCASSLRIPASLCMLDKSPSWVAAINQDGLMFPGWISQHVWHDVSGLGSFSEVEDLARPRVGRACLK